MRAVRFHAARDIRVEDVPEPADPGPHELVLKPRLCGICGTDLHEFMAGPIVTPTEPHPLTGAQNPQILGHEFSADVVAVGDDVTTARPGDRVAVMPLAFCGECYYCVRGDNHLCVRMGCVGLSWAWGGLGSLAIVNEYQVAVLPSALSYEQGALIEPAAVAVYGIERGGVRAGDSVVITGGGPIGALAALAARAAGAGAVFLSEPNGVRARNAEALEVTEIFDPSATNVPEELRRRTGERPALDHRRDPRPVVDVVAPRPGDRQVVLRPHHRTHLGGAYVQPGLHDGAAAARRHYAVVQSARVAGALDGDVDADAAVERIVTSRVGLEETVPGGFEVLVDPRGSEVKVLVEVG
jgi:(R,R)-butanediol dehydrogenase / meso-butanediol dehydrogenase / diacetyl reductase